MSSKELILLLKKNGWQEVRQRGSHKIFKNENEGEAEKLGLKDTGFSFSYSVDLEAFFDKIPEIKITNIARRSGLNPSLVRQYAKGLKFPSIEQANRIEQAVRSLGQELLEMTAL